LLSNLVICVQIKAKVKISSLNQLGAETRTVNLNNTGTPWPTQAHIHTHKLRRKYRVLENPHFSVPDIVPEKLQGKIQEVANQDWCVSQPGLENMDYYNTFCTYRDSETAGACLVS